MNDITGLPEDAQAYIKQLREEAKSNRLKASELEGKLTERDTAVAAASARITELSSKANVADEIVTKYNTLQDEHAKTLTESAKLALDHTRLRVALDAGLPHNLASRLTGDTEDALKADAAELKGFVAATGTRVDRTSVKDAPQSEQAKLRAAIAAQIESE